MAGPPASMRAKGGASSSTGGNRSPPRQSSQAADHAPGAMRAFSPNSGMASSASRSPPSGMTSAGASGKDSPRVNPDGRNYLARRVPAGYSNNRGK